MNYNTLYFGMNYYIIFKKTFNSDENNGFGFAKASCVPKKSDQFILQYIKD